MIAKSISSTQAQNNFGQVLDDVTQNRTHYIIERRGIPQAILLSFDDFAYLLSNEAERQQIEIILKEVRPTYRLGQVLNPTTDSK